MSGPNRTTDAKPTTSTGHIQRYRNDIAIRRGPMVDATATTTMNAMLTTNTN